jgi:2-hydroxychromene-2-carboxylate isomerase
MNTVLPLRVALQVQEASPTLYRPFCLSVFSAYWSHDEDISQPEVVAALCDDSGLDGRSLVEGASRDEVKGALRSVTGAALEAGVFGAPSTVVHVRDGSSELFWGADRMELALKYASGGGWGA